MRISYLIHGLSFGGAEKQLLELSGGLIRLSLVRPEEIQVISFRDNGGLDDAFRRLQVGLVHAPRARRRDPGQFRRVHRLLGGFQPGLVHSWTQMTTLYAWPAARRLGVPLLDGSIRYSHRMKPWSKFWFVNRLVFRLADHVVANSRAGLECQDVPACKSSVIHNGFNMARLQHLADPAGARAEIGAEGMKVVGMVANFGKAKDYDTFIRAALEVLAQREDVLFVTVGQGPQRERCRALVPHHWRSRVLFLDVRSSIEPLISAFDIGVLATFTEGISNFVTECMALSRPVVATDGGGTAELLADGETGFLVPPRDPAALAAKLVRLLDDPALCRRMGEAGRRRIAGEFSADRMVHSYWDLYRRLVGA